MDGLKCVVVGGAGALGRQVARTLLSAGSKVVSVDLVANSEATTNVIIAQPVAQESNLALASESTKALGPFDAVFCVAGGWTGGNAALPGWFQGMREMWERNVLGATLAAAIGTGLKEGGLLVFTSAKASLNPTPFMISYGATKAATNHLVSSLASPKSGLPAGCCVTAILPETLDTATNRESMPGADFGSWTPLDAVADKFSEWLVHPESRPGSGQLVAVITRNGSTAFETVQ